MIIWILGLSGSGKSTAGRQLYKQWKKDSPATVFLDGDEIRRIFKHNTGNDPYTLEGRRINADRIQSLCLWLDSQAINVVCCILSIFEESRIWNRENYSNYLEVYLHASDEILSKRRDLYKKAKNGEIKNVVGVDIPFSLPTNPDLTFDTGEKGNSPDKIATKIYEILKS